MAHDKDGLWKISRNWVFDVKKLVGYRVELDKKGTITNRTEAFRFDNDTMKVTKLIDVPYGTLRKSKEVLALVRDGKQPFEN